MRIRNPDEKLKMTTAKISPSVEDRISVVEKKLDKIIVMLKNKVLTVGCATTVDIENNKKEI